MHVFSSVRASKIIWLGEKVRNSGFWQSACQCGAKWISKFILFHNTNCWTVWNRTVHAVVAEARLKNVYFNFVCFLLQAEMSKHGRCRVKDILTCNCTHTTQSREIQEQFWSNIIDGIISQRCLHTRNNQILICKKMEERISSPIGMGKTRVKLSNLHVPRYQNLFCYKSVNCCGSLFAFFENKFFLLFLFFEYLSNKKIFA